MPRLSAVGNLDSSLKGWLFTFAHQNYWRVAHVMEFEDIIQDGYEVYARCRHRYAATAQNQRHFMGLFQKSFARHITTLARTSPNGMTPKYCYRSETKKDERPDLLPYEAEQIEATGAEENGGPFSVFLKEASFPVSAVLALFLTESGQKAMKAHRQRRAEPLNNYLCRLIGISPAAYDLPTLVSSFLHKEEVPCPT